MNSLPTQLYSHSASPTRCGFDISKQKVLGSCCFSSLLQKFNLPFKKAHMLIGCIQPSYYSQLESIVTKRKNIKLFSLLKPKSRQGGYIYLLSSKKHTPQQKRERRIVITIFLRNDISAIIVCDYFDLT